MNLMGSQDFSFVDFDELGIRPSNYIDECSDVDLDETADGHLSPSKLHDLKLMSNGKQFMLDDADALMVEEDDSDYEVDPETGEKIFGAVSPLAASSSFAFTNDKWVVEYLSHIESASSSTSQSIPLSAEAFFEDISLSPEPRASSWFPNYIPLDELPNHLMFSEQHPTEISGNSLHITPPMHMPFPNKHSQDSFVTLLSASNEDDYSVGSSTNSSRRQRVFSSVESDSTTRDSDQTFDGAFLEAKLEKIEHDEHSIPPMFARRLSARVNCQGQHDEDTLRRYNIPLTVEDITQSSTEDYNHHLARLAYLNAEQMHIIKDIRRRGKNKIAAQNCRKRKATSVESLREEVDRLKRMKQDLEQRQRSYRQQIVETRNQYEYLHQQVLPDRQLPPAIIVK